jgi:hypothetical protein
MASGMSMPEMSAQAMPTYRPQATTPRGWRLVMEEARRIISMAWGLLAMEVPAMG